MGRRRKNKPRELTPREHLVETVTGILASDNITPWQIFQVIRFGHGVLRTGVYETVIDDIITAFEKQGRTYLTPDQMAQMRGRNEPLWPDDVEHLED